MAGGENERITAEDARAQVFQLVEETSAFLKEAEDILQLEPVVEMTGDVCLDKDLDRLSDLSKLAKTLISGDLLDKTKKLRSEITAAVAVLSASAQTTITDNAAAIYRRKAEPLEKNYPILDHLESQLAVVLKGLIVKLITAQDMIGACREDPKAAEATAGLINELMEESAFGINVAITNGCSSPIIVRMRWQDREKNWQDGIWNFSVKGAGVLSFNGSVLEAFYGEIYYSASAEGHFTVRVNGLNGGESRAFGGNIYWPIRLTRALSSGRISLSFVCN